jgi:hypothetical protein
MPAGRPSEYDANVADFICERISHGESLNKIVRDEDMPGNGTVFRWLAARPEFREKYARAREAQMDAMAEEILAIADESQYDFKEVNGCTIVDHENIQRSRLRVDTRKWLMAKLAPKKYGDKQQMEVSSESETSLAEIIHRARQRAGIAKQ